MIFRIIFLTGLFFLAFDALPESDTWKMNRYLEALNNKDNMRRSIAWGQIKQIVETEKDGNWDDFIPLLGKSLDSEYEDVVRNVVVQLGEIKASLLVDKLISMLSHADRWLKIDLINALGLIGDKKAFAALQELDNIYEAEVIEAIARLDTRDSQAFVEARLKHEWQSTRELACRAVERANYRKAIPTLLTMLDDKGVTSISTGPAYPTYVRDCVFDVLGKMKAKRALPVLKKLLENAADIGEVHALIEFGGSDVIAMTAAVLKNGANHKARANSATIFHQLLIQDKVDEEKIGPVLLKGLQDESALVRGNSCVAISATRYKPAIPVLIDLVKDQTEVSHGYKVNGYAFYALIRMQMEETVPFFKELTVGENDIHRRQAASGLISIWDEEIRAFTKDLARNHDNPDVRYRSVTVLGHFKEKEFLEELLLEENEKRVRDLINEYLK